MATVERDELSWQLFWNISRHLLHVVLVVRTMLNWYLVDLFQYHESLSISCLWQNPTLISWAVSSLVLTPSRFTTAWVMKGYSMLEQRLVARCKLIILDTTYIRFNWFKHFMVNVFKTLLASILSQSIIWIISLKIFAFAKSSVGGHNMMLIIFKDTVC